MITLYPTDTVYGLGVDATDSVAIQKLRELKGSGGDKHFPIVVSDIEMAHRYAVFTPLAERLAVHFWPGKLTIVLKPKNLPPELGTNSGEIGIRIPNHPVAQKLVHDFGCPITATSANVSGQPQARTVSEILAQLGDKKILIYHNPEWQRKLPKSLPSTVVDARGDAPVIVREGAIRAEDILKV